MPQRRADAIRSRIAAADHDHVQARGADVGAVVQLRIEQALGVPRQEVHRVVDAQKFPAGQGQIARHGGSRGQQQGVVILLQLAGIDEANLLAALLHDPRHVPIGKVLAAADVRPRDEFHAFLAQQVDPPLDDGLVQLHVGDAVHQQAADAIGPLEDGDLMADLVQLGGGRQTGGAGADHGDLLAGASFRRVGLDPAFGKAAVDDRVLDVLDRHRRVVDAQHAGAFAGRRTDAAGEFRKVVRLVQAVQRVPPTAAIDQVVPFRDQIVDRTAAAGHAEGNAAVHAAGTLRAQVAFGGIGVDLVEVRDPLDRRTVGHGFARILFETGWLSHELKIPWLCFLAIAGVGSDVQNSIFARTRPCGWIVVREN